MSEATPADLPRRIAAILAPELDPLLPPHVERALTAQGETTYRTLDAGTSIALAAFLLSVTQFAWQVYRDLKKDREEKQRKQKEAAAAAATPVREVMARRLRLQFSSGPIDGARRDRLFEVVIDEVIEESSRG